METFGFIFGQNDKPLYIQGPSESPACVERILRVLEARCGEVSYHYIVAGDNFEPLDGEEQNGESAVTDPLRLEQMAARLRASQPRHVPLEIRRRKVDGCQMVEILEVSS